MSKKGIGVELMVTLWVFIILIVVFIIFIFMFKNLADKTKDQTVKYFESTNTELSLKSFLNSPAAFAAKDLTPNIGAQITNADLIIWTCKDKTDQSIKRNFDALAKSISQYHTKLYGSDWNIIIIYTKVKPDAPDITEARFGYIPGAYDAFVKKVSQLIFLTTALNPTWFPVSISKAAFMAGFRDEGTASQILPCSDERYLAKVIFNKI